MRRRMNHKEAQSEENQLFVTFVSFCRNLIRNIDGKNLRYPTLIQTTAIF